MTTKAELLTLADEVEASEPGAARHELCHKLHAVLADILQIPVDDTPSLGLTIISVLCGAVDSAKELLDAVLPGWLWGRVYTGWMTVAPPSGDKRQARGGYCDNSAAALLAATLRAKAQEMEE